jgi:release factor glutamine methyltransferase
MHSNSAAPDVAEIVAKLRAAGCVFAEDEAQLLVAQAASPD